MTSNERGLPRALNAGDYIILSTGAIATATEAYPAGYEGPVSMALDGQPMSELAETLTLPDPNLHARVSEQPTTVFEDDQNPTSGGVREHGRRMED